MTRKKIIKILKITLPLVLGVFLIIYSIGSATQEERQNLWQNIRNANLFWLILSAICGLLSHASRAYRWKYLIQPLGYKIHFANSFMAVMAAYLANLGIPRSGEVLRGASIATYEKIPFQKVFGTIISERVADLLMLLLIVAGTLLFHTTTLVTFFNEKNINPFFSLLVLFALVMFGLLFLRLIKKSKNKFLKRLKNFAIGILDGMKSILKMRKTFAFLCHTVFIWAMYICMFFLIKYAIPETQNLGFGAIMVAFVVGSFAISITNGGIGVYPIAVGAVLLLFGISKEAGEAFGWIVWGTQTLLNLVIGGLSMLFLPIFNRSN